LVIHGGTTYRGHTFNESEGTLISGWWPGHNYFGSFSFSSSLQNYYKENNLAYFNDSYFATFNPGNKILPSFGNPLGGKYTVTYQYYHDLEPAMGIGDYTIRPTIGFVNWDISSRAIVSSEFYNNVEFTAVTTPGLNGRGFFHASAQESSQFPLPRADAMLIVTSTDGSVNTTVYGEDAYTGVYFSVA
jgi:hypothetical protein